jgi:hypothetical protein
LVIPIIVVFALAATAAITLIRTWPAYAQQQTKSTTSADYIQNAQGLLKQVSAQYKNGSYAKAEELAGTPYLDNFEYAEADLQKHGQSELVSEIEKMMVTDLRGMIKNRASQEQIDSQISAIEAKLTQAIAVVPEFPVRAPVIVISVLVGSVIEFARMRARSLGGGI